MNQKKANFIQTGLFIGLMVVAQAASAAAGNSGGGTWISDLHTFISSALEGMVGITIAIAGLGYGLIAGIAKGSIAGLGIGFGLAIAAFYGPKIISAMATATIVAF